MALVVIGGFVVVLFQIKFPHKSDGYRSDIG